MKCERLAERLGRRWIHPFWIAAVGFLAQLFIGHWIEPLDRRVHDSFFRARYVLDAALRMNLLAPLPESVVVLLVDDGDLNRFPTLEAEYKAVGQAVRDCRKLGADLVVLDAVFRRASQEAAKPLTEAIAAIQADGARVVFAEFSQDGEVVTSFPFQSRPVPAGDIALTRDRDRIVRDYVPVQVRGQIVVPSLALTAFLEGDQVYDRQNLADGGIRWTHLAGSEEKSGFADSSALRLNFREPWATNRGWRLVDSKLGEREFKRFWNLRALKEKAASSQDSPLLAKTVFLGYSAQSAGDLVDTPLGDRELAVMVHVQAYSDWLQDAWVKHGGRFWSALFVGALLFVLLLPLGAIRSQPGLIFMLGVSWLIVWAVAFAGFAIFRGLLAGQGFAAMGLCLGMATELMRRWALERVAHRKVLANLKVKTGPNDSTPDYWAFISYSSKNRREVRKLHRELRQFTVPPDLVARETAVGRIPSDLKPIFLDRVNARSSKSVPKELGRHLGNSAFLIVACSPESAESDWVGKEIEHFKDRDDEDRVSAILLESVPPGQTSASFHAELGDIPLAADRREFPVGDGRRGALLKLVAGMLELDFEELQRLDAERREVELRKQSAWFAAAGLVMAGLVAAFVLLWTNYVKTHRELLRTRQVLGEPPGQIYEAHENPTIR